MTGPAFLCKFNSFNLLLRKSRSIFGSIRTNYHLHNDTANIVGSEPDRTSENFKVYISIID